MKVRVYDLPTRVFHWLLAMSFLTAFVIANTSDDDGFFFSYHMIAGLVMTSTVLWRLAWGIWGSKYARFSNFTLNISELIDYLKGIFVGRTKKWFGHNPASSWAGILMMALAFGLGTSGITMALGQGGEFLEEIHEIMANAFIILVILHIGGVAVHQLRHKDSLAKSMVTGVKSDLPAKTSSVNAHTVLGVGLFIFTVFLSSYLLSNFDTKRRNLNVFGVQLHLSEPEGYDSNYQEHDND